MNPTYIIKKYNVILMEHQVKKARDNNGFMQMNYRLQNQ